MTVLVCTANITPQDGNSLYSAEDDHDSDGHIDTYIDEANATTNNGSATNIGILDYSGSDEQRGLLKFDMSDLPASASITSAHLQVYVELISVSATYGAYGLKRDWVEGEATWNIFSTGNNWGTAGAKNTSSDIDSAAQDTDTTGTSSGVWMQFDVTDWVQDIADSVRSNFGLLIARTTLPNDSHYCNLSSSEQTDGQRPELWIDYEEGSAIEGTVNQASETDVAQSIAAQKIQELGQVAESDSAQAIGSSKSAELSQASESDQAQSFSSGIMRTVNQVTESDLAQALAIQKIAEVSGVNETDTAQQLAAQRVVALAQVEENTQAATIPAAKAKGLAQVSESEVAQAISQMMGAVLGQASEADASQPVDPELRRLVGQIPETEVALAIVRLTGTSLNQAIETDTAMSIGTQRVVALAQATSSEESFAVALSKAKALGVVTETDLAQAIRLAGVGDPATIAITGVWNPIKTLTGHWN